MTVVLGGALMAMVLHGRRINRRSNNLIDALGSQTETQFISFGESAFFALDVLIGVSVIANAEIKGQ